jgi:hypothetical protein
VLIACLKILNSGVGIPESVDQKDSKKHNLPWMVRAMEYIQKEQAKL